MSNQKIPCTIAILTKNSDGTLPRAMKGLEVFEQIIVCDGGSTDRTLDIARQAGAQILSQNSDHLGSDGRIIDFAGVRNQTLVASTQPWYFFLDSDEYLSPGLVEEIRSVTQLSSPAAYKISRKYTHNGRVIDVATTYPNFSMRFFSREMATAFIKKVHERIELKGNSKIGILKQPLLVPINPDIHAGWVKDSLYIQIEIKRFKNASWSERTNITFQTLKTSLLYAARLIRNSFRPGVHMPLVFELDRHFYHAKLLAALWNMWLIKSPTRR